jgi:Fe-S cluster assembly iron-binding protein IscA
MLQIAADALDALAELGAIRITGEEVDGEVELSIDDATEPAEGDEIVEQGGARIFLDAVAADALADQVIGVHAHGDHFHFTFDDQEDGGSSPTPSSSTTS